MNYIFGYGRSSTRNQSITTDAQKTACESWFQIQVSTGRFADGVEWGGWYEDRAVSSDAPWFERAAGDSVLGAARSGDIIVVSMYDRAFRSVSDCSNSIKILADKNVRIVILDTPEIDTTTANGILIVNILAAVKEHEKRIIRERTRDAFAEKLRQRRPTCSRPPRGWKIVVLAGEKRLVPDEYARNVADYITNLHDEEGLSFERIYWRLHIEGVRAPGGENFGVSRIRFLHHARVDGYPLSPDPHVQQLLSLLGQQGRVENVEPSLLSSDSGVPAE